MLRDEPHSIEIARDTSMHMETEKGKVTEGETWRCQKAQNKAGKQGPVKASSRGAWSTRGDPVSKTPHARGIKGFT